MEVNVKYFGEVVDRTQKSEEKIEVDNNVLSDLIQLLNKQYVLQDLNLKIAVNEEIITDIYMYLIHTTPGDEQWFHPGKW